MNFFKNKKILVTGGTGMVGMALIKLLKESEAKIKKIKKRELLRKLKSKGHMTHGSKYGKLKSGLSINGKNR